MSKKLPARRSRVAAKTSDPHFATELLAWFSSAARDLPWRKSRELYRIWISEIMLQQTQVATVIDYYQRFLQAFPTITALAAAEEAEVLRLWEGLGYYRRARQLHAAAKKMVAEYAGEFPREIEQVRSLPGIGRYTAGAILSIGLDQRLPILEANTIRLFSRLAGYQDDPHGSAGQAFLWSFAEQILPAENVGAFNQALMEVGSLICTPKNPRCEDCPLANRCQANKLALQDQIPLPKKKVKFEEVTEIAVIVACGAEVFLKRQQAGERWAGLWDFVRFPWKEATSGETLEALAAHVAAVTGFDCDELQPLTTLKHGVTRFRITLHCFMTKLTSGSKRKAKTQPAETAWVPLAELADYPLHVTARKIARLLVANQVTKKSLSLPAVQTPARNARSQGTSGHRAK